MIMILETMCYPTVRHKSNMTAKIEALFKIYVSLLLFKCIKL